MRIYLTWLSKVYFATIWHTNPCYEFKELSFLLSCYFGDYTGLVLLDFLSAI